MKTVISRFILLIFMITFYLPGKASTEKVIYDDLIYIIDTSNQTAQLTYEHQTSSENYASLDTITIPSEIMIDSISYVVNMIGEWALNRALASVITLPSTIRTIGYESMAVLPNCKELIIPEGVELIQENAFMKGAVERIILPNSVYELQYGAFAVMDNLKYVELGSGLNSIGGEAFNYSSNIDTIVCHAENPPLWEYGRSSTFTQSTLDNAILFVHSNSLQLYKNNDDWGNFKNIRSIEEDPDRVEVQEISIVPESITLSVGQQFRFKVDVMPYEANDWYIIWSSSDNEILNIDSKGLVTALKSGSAIISAMVGGTDITSQASVTIIENSETTRVKIGDFYYILHPDDNTAELTYEFFENDNNYSYLGTIVEVPEYVDYDGVEFHVNYIGESALGRVLQMEYLTLPPSIIGIKHDGVCETGLKRVEIGDNCEFLAYGSFAWSYGIKEVVIGSSVLEIGGESFWQSDLEKIVCKVVTPPDLSTNWMPVFNDASHNDAILYVPEGSLELYKNDEYWGLFQNIKSLKELPDYDTSGKDDLVKQQIAIKCINDGINISNAKDINLEVFTIEGKLIYNTRIASNYEKFILNKGVYIVKVGDVVNKISIK